MESGVDEQRHHLLPGELDGLVDTFWPGIRSQTEADNGRQAYMLYVQDQAEFGEVFNLITKSGHVSTIVKYINDHPRTRKANLIQYFKGKCTGLGQDDASLSATLDAIARLWLMVNVRTDAVSQSYSVESAIPWPSDRGIGDVIEQNLGAGYIASPRSSRQRFPDHCTLDKFSRIAGFQIWWTDNLLDHLSFKNDNCIALFYHVSILRRMKQSVSSEVISDTLIDETLETLSLLLPRVNAESRTWLRQQQAKHQLDGEVGNLPPASREINRYHHWKDRLLIILEAFDESQPSTLSQWWHDRRNRVQWYTFWVAIVILVLTIIFGLIQTVASVVQAWASVVSLQV